VATGAGGQDDRDLAPEYARAVETRNQLSAGWTMGWGMARPIVAYLVVVGLAAWVAFGAAVWSGVGALGVLAIGLFPAMVLTIELVHRSGTASPLARMVLGAVSWAAWGATVAILLAVASRIVVVPELVLGGLVLLAGSGAAFSVLAFDRSAVRPSRALALGAVAVAALVVLGAIWMAGRWGGPA